MFLHTRVYSGVPFCPTPPCPRAVVRMDFRSMAVLHRAARLPAHNYGAGKIV